MNITMDERLKQLVQEWITNYTNSNKHRLQTSGIRLNELYNQFKASMPHIGLKLFKTSLTDAGLVHIIIKNERTYFVLNKGI